MKIRLYTPQKIEDCVILEAEQTHYLIKVMRQNKDSTLTIFNKNCGEFLVEIEDVHRHHCTCKVIKKITDFTPPDVNLRCIFSVIKPKNVEFIMQKCTELGVTDFIPMYTSRTVYNNINIERLNKIIKEATEQCGRIDIPEIYQPIRIKDLEPYTKNYEVFLLNQTGTKNFHLLQANRCIIVGPEGGLTDGEISRLEEFSQKIMISENVLRAETATILGCGMLMI